MKNFLLNIYEKTQKLTFFQGVVVTVCFTSVVSIAASNLVNGFFVFSANTPISASEINANFERLAGAVVVKASFSTPFTINQNNFIVPPECPTCNSYRKRIFFNSISAGTISQALDTDTSSGSYSSNFHYYQVPSDGWYEIRLTGNLVSEIDAATTCDSSNCNININAGVNIQVADSLAQSTNPSYSYGANWVGKSRDLRDNNYDAAFDPAVIYPGSLPDARRYFLKAGQILFVRFDSSYNVQYATPAVTAGLNTADLTVIKL